VRSPDRTWKSVGARHGRGGIPTDDKAAEAERLGRLGGGINYRRVVVRAGWTGGSRLAALDAAATDGLPCRRADAVYAVPERSLHTSRLSACLLQISTNRLNYGRGAV